LYNYINLGPIATIGQNAHGLINNAAALSQYVKIAIILVYTALLVIGCNGYIWYSDDWRVVTFLTPLFAVPNVTESTKSFVHVE